MKSLQTFIHTVLETLFPEYCLSCKKVGEGRLCTNCRLRLSPTLSTAEENIFALFPYEDVIKKLLWELKYHSNARVAEIVAVYLADSLVELQAEHLSLYPKSGPAILVPVPIARSREFKRGFNQAESLARAVAQNYPESFVVDTTLVRKIRSTKPQVTCASRAERLTNVVGAFEAHLSQELCHKQIIIIDDVTTTGATMREIVKVLREAGAHNVSALAVAHGSKMC